ncbi:MAG: hypothetical protein D6832_01675, partial [Alphaproteobacteria bacterium]
HLPVPPTLHEPIEQAAVLLPGPAHAEAAAFLDFLTGPEGRARIAAAGYGLPPGSPADG